MVAVELCCRPISKSANQSDYRGSFARLEFRHDGIEGTRIPGVRANVKTHLVHPHERGLVRTYMLARTHARTHTCTRARPRFLWSDQWLEWLALDVEPKIPLGLPPRSSSSFRPFVVSVRARSGYLLRGRCGLNLINSMRHLDKCAPRTCIHRE